MAIVTTTSDSVRASPSAPEVTWQEAIRTAIRDAAELCRQLSLPDEVASAAGSDHAFGVFVPRDFAKKMVRGDPGDPLLRQVLPTANEQVRDPQSSSDPVGDQLAALSPGLIKKYERRALLITTGACAVHCRYCFRREFPYDSVPHSIHDWQPAMDRIEADATIEEIILSGGDPLMLVDEQLAALANRLARIPHVTRLRIHTRLPIMIPQRVTDAMLRWLTGTRLVPLVVVHTNHPNEIDEAVGAALKRLVEAGVPVLNQTVLLDGINDSADILVELSRRLISVRVLPYYLHQLDPVHGATHFEVPVARGKRIVQRMRELLPGYAVPRYVQERAGHPAKSILA